MPGETGLLSEIAQDNLTLICSILTLHNHEVQSFNLKESCLFLDRNTFFREIITIRNT